MLSERNVYIQVISDRHQLQLGARLATSCMLSSHMVLWVDFPFQQIEKILKQLIAE